jgi:hypothetical protein
VHHDVLAFHSREQAFRFAETSDRDLDCAGLEPGGIARGPDQGADAYVPCRQGFDEVGTNKPRSPCDENI